MATGDRGGNHRSSLSSVGVGILAASGLGIVAEGVRVSSALQDGVQGRVIAAELVITTLGLIAFVWLMFFFLWARGAIRVRMLAAEKPDAVFVDVLLNGRLSIDLDQINAVVGVPPKRMYTPGYVTVVASKEGFEFYSRAFRPRQLCWLPAELVSSLHIETIAFETRTVTRYFPAIIVTARGQAEGFTVGMMPMLWTAMIPRKLNKARMRAAVEALATSVGAVASA